MAADRFDDEGQPSEDAWLTSVFLGVVELYGFDTLKYARVYDFTRQAQRDRLDAEKFQTLTAKIRKFRSHGRLVAAYVPLRLFGGSPRLGLSFPQRQLLLAIHRELTRERKSLRADKAHVFSCGQGSSQAAPVVIDHDPGLQEGQRYVGFNGNGGARRPHYRGRGYRILGERGWLVRARYVVGAKGWPQVRVFLKDLQYVGQVFGLVAAGRHRRSGVWLELADLLDQTRTPAGQRWLNACVLRIYTADDYLRRWRRLIAARMGVADIPERDHEQPAGADPTRSPV